MRRLGLALALAGALLWARPAAADSLTLTPLRQELTIPAGQAQTGTLTVTNSGKDPAIVAMSAEAFSVTDEAYDYKLDASSQLVRWIEFANPSVRLSPGGSYTFNYTINVPTGIEPGGKYISLIAALSGSRGSGITTVERAASLLYINVPGQTTAGGRLVDISVSHLSLNRELNVYIRVENSGNTHFRSRQTLDTLTLAGRKLDEQNANHLVLPGTIRLNSARLQLGNWPGLYRLKILVGLGDKPAVSRNLWVLYLPPWRSLILVGAVATGVLALARRRPRLK